MGALIFTNKTYSNTLPLILQAGLPLSPALSPGPSANWTYFQYSPGIQGAQNVTATPLPGTAELGAIELEVARYTLFWNTQFSPDYTGSRYLVSLSFAGTYLIEIFLLHRMVSPRS